VEDKALLVDAIGRRVTTVVGKRRSVRILHTRGRGGIAAMTLRQAQGRLSRRPPHTLFDGLSGGLGNGDGRKADSEAFVT
jgi:hypothetical protein